MGATSKWFLLMLGEKNDALLPVYNRAIDIVGAMRLAFMFSLIDEHLAKRSRFALKDSGQLRTRGGVAIQLMKSLPSSGYIFGRTERERNSALNGACNMGNLELDLLPPLERQDVFYGRFATRLHKDLRERPIPTYPTISSVRQQPQLLFPLSPVISPSVTSPLYMTTLDPVSRTTQPLPKAPTPVFAVVTIAMVVKPVQLLAVVNATNSFYLTILLFHGSKNEEALDFPRSF